MIFNRKPPNILLLLIAFFLIGLCSSFAQDLDKLITLDIEDLMNIEVVSATKTQKKISEAPSTIISITGEEIEEMGARTLSDVLKMVPGVQVLNRRNGRDMIWIRGVTTGYNTKILLQIDGIPYREAIFGEWSPDEEIQLNNIDRIEIIRGPGSALYGGNAYSGVISIFTKDDVDVSDAAVSIGSNNTHHVEFYSGKEVGDSKLIVSGKVYDSDGYKMERDRKGYETEHKDHVNAKNIQAKYINNNFRFSLTKNDFETDYPLYETGKDKLQYYNITNGFADYTLEKNKLTIHPKFYFYHVKHFFDMTTRDTTGKLQAASERHLESMILGFDGQMTYSVSENNTLVSGLFMEHHDAKKYYEENTLATTAVTDIEYIDDNGEPVELYRIDDYEIYSWLNKDAGITSTPGIVNTVNYAAYVQDEMRFIDDKVNLTVGLRFDEYEGFDAEFSPRAGLVFNPNKELTLKILGGKAFKPPTYRQKYMVRIDGRSPGNPDVGPERITTIETELGYNFKNNIIARINYFNNTLTDFIESVNYATYSNSSDKRKISGIELDVRTDGTSKIDLIDTFSIFTNYSYMDAFDEINSTRVKVPSIARHSANLGIKLRNRWGTLFSGWNFVGKRNKSSSYHNSVKVDDYRIRDNKGSYMIWDVNFGLNAFSHIPFKFDITIHNLLDTEHYNPTYDPDEYYDFHKERRNIMFRITMEM
ncbi:TonB-dependent receptor plug domain-containing protein [Candidatus Latescibacterota bacterium]